jgi:hypothetical protein
MTKPGVPDTVSNLDHNVVTEVLSRHACNVTDASKDLGVSPSDLRRLLWANPKLQDAAFEVVESRLELAEKNIAEALNSDDSRRRDAASFFVIRNSVRAKRRGWITTSSASVDLNVSSNLPPRQVVFRWRTSEDDEREKRAVESGWDDGAGTSSRMDLYWSTDQRPSTKTEILQRPPIDALAKGLGQQSRLRVVLRAHLGHPQGTCSRTAESGTCES